MLGKVLGPYGKSNLFVNINLYNDDGSIKNRLTKRYVTYLKEASQGLHKYETYIPLTETEQEIRNFQRRNIEFDKIRKEYNLPIVTEENKEQFYYPNAFEIEKMPGYYYIPFAYSTYAISKQGEVINLETNKLLKYYINNSGYYSLNILLKINKKYIQIAHHRTYGLLFIPRPDRHLDKSYSDLEVNHKDGIKINNDLNNLEWVTSIENNDHAVVNGLNTVSDIAKPVLAKNVITGEIKKYISVGTCAKDFCIEQPNLSQHLYSKKYGLVSVDNYIFKYDDNTPWPNRPPIVKNNRGYFRTAPSILVKNISTNETIIFKSIDDAIKQLKLNNSVHKHLKEHGKDTPYKNYLFSTLDKFIFN